MGYKRLATSQLVCPPQSCLWLVQRLEAQPCPAPSMGLFWNSPWGRNLRAGGKEAPPFRGPLPWAQPPCCGCGWVTAAHWHFKDSLHLKLQCGEGGDIWPRCQRGLSNSGLPSGGPGVGCWGSVKVPGGSDE